jgi:hypothetical protein
MVKTYEEMKAWINEKPGERFFGCPKCEGTDKWCILEMDDERGAVCERHGVIVPNVELSGPPR